MSVKEALETRMMYKGIAFRVFLEEDRLTHPENPNIRLAIKVARPYRPSPANGELALELYQLLTADVPESPEGRRWLDFDEAKKGIAKVAYEKPPSGLQWYGSWYKSEVPCHKKGGPA